MRKILRSHQGLTLGAAVTLVTCLAGGVRGQEAAPAPIVTPAIDAATLAKATAKGQQLLNGEKWEVKLDIGTGSPPDNARVRIAGSALVCDGRIGFKQATRALDIRNGHMLWQTDSTLGARVAARLVATSNSPIAWTEKGVEHFAEAEGQLSLWLRTADLPEGKASWETKYEQAETLPWQPGNPTLAPIAVFAGQQIIAGEEVTREAMGGSFQRTPLPATSLTLRSMDRATGKIQWATPVPEKAVAATVAVVAEGKVFVLVSETDGSAGDISPQKGFVMALNAADGKVLWKSQPGIRAIDAAERESMLVALAEDGEVIACDASSGKEMWRTALSPECDPAKSKVGTLSSTSDRVYLDKEGVLVNVLKRGPVPPDVAAKLTFLKYIGEPGIAALNAQSGKQTGYFTAKGIMADPPVTNPAIRVPDNPISNLSAHGHQIIAQIGTQGCIGVDRKALTLDWFIPGTSSVSADGVVYANTGSARNNKPNVVHAVPLDPAR